MRILVIGGAGVIGSGIVDSACAAGHDVITITRNKTPLINSPSNVRRIYADWTDLSQARNALGDITADVIVDGRIFNKEQAKRDWELIEGRCEQFIYISTAGVYEPSDHKINEDSPKDVKNLKWAYSHNKRKAEIFFESLRTNTHITTIRPPVTYGDSRIPCAVVSPRYTNHWTIVDRVLNKKPIVFINDGGSRSQVTHISTFGDATVATFLNADAYNMAFHIVDDKRYTWDDVINTVGEIVGEMPRIVHVPLEELKFYNDALYQEVKCSKFVGGELDNERIKAIAPNVNYCVPLREGLQGTVKYLRSHYAQRPLDEEFNMMCDAILLNCNLNLLPENEADIVKRYIGQLSPQYIDVLKKFFLYSYARERIVHPIKKIIPRPIKKILRPIKYIIRGNIIDHGK